MEKEIQGFIKIEENDEIFSSIFFKKNKEKIKKLKATSLQKLYNSYPEESTSIDYDIWLAKLYYQEGRGIFPSGFVNFIKEIEKKITKDKIKLKEKTLRDFLEVLVAYQKYFSNK